MVKLGAGTSFFGVGHVFPKIIDGYAEARLVHRLGCAECVFHSPCRQRNGWTSAVQKRIVQPLLAESDSRIGK